MAFDDHFCIGMHVQPRMDPIDLDAEILIYRSGTITIKMDGKQGGAIIFHLLGGNRWSDFNAVASAAFHCSKVGEY